MRRNKKNVLIGIHKDRYGWYQRYTEYSQKHGFNCVVFNMLADDWLDTARKCEVVFFKSSMYPENIRIFKERVYFLSRVLGIPTFPNWNSFWHFDSKAIQRDLLREYGMRIPTTVVAATHEDIAEIEKRFCEEVIVKDSAGAGSSRVRKAKLTRRLKRRLLNWQLDSGFYRSVSFLLRKIGLQPLWSPQRILQEVVVNEGYDLRVVTIGTRYAYVFKRLVRRGDFRASASGLIDYSWDDKYYAIMSECIKFSRKMGFNNMAYDVLVDLSGNWFIGEMSCQYTGNALLNCPNVFDVGDDLRTYSRMTIIDPLELHIRSFAESLSSPDYA